ncbi:Uu.00g009740.m01.CDS01 [Anthostomella pinea]|uniref:Uu.00g009740.m01.CDS01 n=1 Tax=Anthostomella pinea TaxID=933095 RepID=A0AAI8VYC2_9PEZI|nr:Uu.00g009740.m01.CDS01 [Anthostomella pinea]
MIRIEDQEQAKSHSSSSPGGVPQSKLVFSPEIARAMKLALGITGNHLAFLDHDSWVCTVDVTSMLSPPTVHRTLLNGGDGGEIRQETVIHFYLPKDWLGARTAYISIMNRDGTVFCPKQADVAIMRDGLLL